MARDVVWDSYTAGKEGREMFMCLRENTDKTSPSCQDAMSKMRRPQPAGG